LTENKFSLVFKTLQNLRYLREEQESTEGTMYMGPVYREPEK